MRHYDSINTFYFVFKIYTWCFKEHFALIFYNFNKLNSFLQQDYTINEITGMLIIMFTIRKDI